MVKRGEGHFSSLWKAALPLCASLFILLAPPQAEEEETAGSFQGYKQMPARLPVHITITNTSEYKRLSEFNPDQYTGVIPSRPTWIKFAEVYYIVDYDAEMDGELSYSQDFQQFDIAAGKSYPGYKLNIKKAHGVLCRAPAEADRDKRKPVCKTYSESDFQLAPWSASASFSVTYLPDYIPVKDTNIGFGPILLISHDQDCQLDIEPIDDEDRGVHFIMTPAMITEALKTGEFQKTFQWGRKTDELGSYYQSTLKVKIEFGFRSLINQPSADKHCPQISGLMAYNRSFNPNLSDLNIVVKIKLQKVKAVPYKRVGVVKTPQGDITIYVSPVEVGGKKPQPIEIPDDQLQRLKELWEMQIIEAWNDQFVLKRKDGKGKPVKINFDVQFVDTGESHHLVNVIPGEGRADEENWYVNGGPCTIGHEFGHFLGLDDEYYAPRECPGRPRPKDDNIMDNSCRPPRARHFQQFADWLTSITKTPWEIVKAK